ncbi:saccharopine dehydrogenase [Sphingomonas lacunae]|uniref:Saccharopine dehydrogenase n=1 Tax=Sphingomonas lacunae TaxID=2698828 RepID=A0A6M4AZ23_9SPHN|nr:saccharopine dehydrogenase NADP-binding domain-containing protein [Sphingomonas lacunae]QJQ32271.1 saccharopine dehydrogenase [Sphingomonas lacunae]
MTPLTVLIIGATGVFGSRLVERAAREPGIRLILAGRTRSSLEELARRVAPGAAIRPLDRDALTAADLAGADVVVDAAGPFQASHDRVIRAAIAARIPYVDLADGRDFVAAIGVHDAAARAAGISVISGASSVPALSHAVIDTLTAGWQGIEAIRVGIFPGNRAPRGLAVVQAILSWAGKPMRGWRDGRWQALPGWGETQRWTMPDGTRRWASLCDTPDQDLLVSHYAPRRTADFFAGLELAVLHLGLSAASLPVRWRLIASLRPLARPLRWFADWFVPLGSDRGYMDVHVRGEDATGTSVTARWTLRAEGNRGPFVPTLATLALLRRHRDGQAPAPGARACINELALSDFTGDFAELGIETAVSDLASRQTAP